MASVGKFRNLFKQENLQSYQVGGDEGYAHQLMDRMNEESYHVKRFNNGAQASRPDLLFNLASEWWSTYGEFVERRRW
jgi:hypothetical protein